MKRLPIRSTSLGAAALAAVALLACAPLASAQRLSLAERVARLEQQANAQNDSGSISLVNQVQALQSQVQALQGQIEELKHQVEQSQQRAKDQYIDLDSRIGRLEGRAPGAAAPPPPGAATDQHLNDVDLGANSATPPPPTTPPPQASNPEQDSDAGANLGTGQQLPSDDTGAPTDADAEKEAYDQAFGALKDGRYAESARRFQSFIDAYPSSALSGNAAYWLGESYYVTQNYRIALQTFQNLLEKYPD
ncbi:MAG: YbgF trimerization domain-containing protein, partial [Rhodanobacteraceae bacterium]